MNILKLMLTLLVGGSLVISLASCSTPKGDKLISNDQSRFRQQSNRLPDRESTEQETAYQEAQRKLDMIKK